MMPNASGMKRMTRMPYGTWLCRDDAADVHMNEY